MTWWLDPHARMDLRPPVDYLEVPDGDSTVRCRRLYLCEYREHCEGRTMRQWWTWEEEPKREMASWDRVLSPSERKMHMRAAMLRHGLTS